MSRKQIQLEIFESDLRAKKDRKIYTDSTDKTIRFKFPSRLCIKAACIIIVTIVSFALGVERGKTISKNITSNRLLTDGKNEEVTKEIPIKDEKKQEPIVKTEVREKKEKENKLTTSGYIIQVVTYKKNSSFIEKEVAKLQKDGFNTVIIPDGQYIKICTGKFTNKKDAQANLKKLQQTYKDCFIRKI